MKFPEKEVSEKSRSYNLNRSRKLSLFLYFIPLAILIVIGLIYIPTHNNLLLIPFAILMFIVLFGHDDSSRTCPNCKKWNSVVWTENKNVVRTTVKKTEVNSPLFFKKKNGKRKVKTKEIKTHITKFKGQCQNCGFHVETERKRLF